MKANKFLLVLLSLSLAFSSCKKDEDPAPDNSLPAGNYIKFQGVTYLENQWTASQYWVELGNRPSMKIFLNGPKTKWFGVAFQDAATEKSYKMSGTFDGTNNAAAGFQDGNENYGTVDGTITVKIVNGQKIVEVHGTLTASAPGGISGGQIDARFVWTD